MVPFVEPEETVSVASTDGVKLRPVAIVIAVVGAHVIVCVMVGALEVKLNVTETDVESQMPVAAAVAVMTQLAELEPV
jgi:hypothetical protein